MLITFSLLFLKFVWPIIQVFILFSVIASLLFEVLALALLKGTRCSILLDYVFYLFIFLNFFFSLISLCFYISPSNLKLSCLLFRRYLCYPAYSTTFTMWLGFILFSKETGFFYQIINTQSHRKYIYLIGKLTTNLLHFECTTFPSTLTVTYGRRCHLS